MTTISSATEQPPVAEPLVGRPDVNRKRMARLGWSFTAPSLIMIGLVTIFPIVYSVVLSLSNATVTGNGVSLNGFTGSNYSLVLSSSKWHYALGFTIVYTLVTVLVELVFGTMIALVLERLTAGRGLMMALLLIPWSMITVINAELWGYIYQGTYGVADAILNAVGLGHPNILGTADPGHRRPDDRRHLEDHPVRGHLGAGRAGHAARGHLRGGRGGRLVRLVHLLADHRPAAAAHAGAGRDVPRAAGVRAVRPALRADQRRPGHVD